MVEDTHHKSIPEDVLQDDDQSLSTTQLPSTLYFKSGSPKHTVKCHEDI